MRLRFLLSAVLVAAGLVLGGCTQFRGEWVQDARIQADGTVVPVTGTRQAFRFDPPTTVMTGTYSDPSGTVNWESVNIDPYWTIKNDSVAQFGEFNARIVDGYLLADVGNGWVLRFVRQTGPSVFPPRVKLPPV